MHWRHNAPINRKLSLTVGKAILKAGPSKLSFDRVSTQEISKGVAELFSIRAKVIRIVLVSLILHALVFCSLFVFFSHSFLAGIVFFLFGSLLLVVSVTVFSIIQIIIELRRDIGLVMKFSFESFLDFFEKGMTGFGQEGNSGEEVREVYNEYVTEVIIPIHENVPQEKIPIISKLVSPISTRLILKASSAIGVVVSKALRSQSSKLALNESAGQKANVIAERMGSVSTKIQGVVSSVFKIALRPLHALATLAALCWGILIFFLVVL